MYSIVYKLKDITIIQWDGLHRCNEIFSPLNEKSFQKLSLKSPLELLANACNKLETDMMKAGEMKLAVWGERKESWAGVRADHWLPLKNLTARGARPSMAGGGMEESWGADSVLASQPRLTKSDTFQSAGDP